MNYDKVKRLVLRYASPRVGERWFDVDGAAYVVRAVKEGFVYWGPLGTDYCSRMTAAVWRQWRASGYLTPKSRRSLLKINDLR